jgi:hypothetical protein
MSSAADFQPHVGATFRFEGWDGTLRLATIETQSPPGWPAALPPPFTLIFHGVRGDVLPEGVHTAQAADGTRFTFHIMPIHTVAPDRQDYQVAFN